MLTKNLHNRPTLRSRLGKAEAVWLENATGGGGDFAGANAMRERERRIREAAYFRAERRGFEPDHSLEDWLAAELEVNRASRPLPES